MIEEGMETYKKSPLLMVISHTNIEDLTVQLVDDGLGGYFLRWLSADGQELSRSQPLYGDPVALAEARELFPEHLPFNAMPVDAT